MLKPVLRRFRSTALLLDVPASLASSVSCRPKPLLALVRPRHFASPLVAKFASKPVQLGLSVGCGLGVGFLLKPPAQCDGLQVTKSEMMLGTKLERRASSKAALTALTAKQAQSMSPLAVTLRTLRSLLRTLYLCAVFGPLILSWPLSRAIGCTDAWWRWCVRCFESSGALLIKLAQWSSSRPDLFGAHACAQFTHLQDATNPHKWSATEASLSSMFGEGWREVLRLDPSPIGSGCIAQVYRGELLERSTGEWKPVAVKVIHPDVSEYIEVDMDLLRTVGWLLESVPKLKWLNPSGEQRAGFQRACA